MKLSRILLYFIWIIPAALVMAYAWNPLGVPSWDPRGRLLGVIPYRVPSDSMSPTFKRDSYIVACTASYIQSTPTVADVIVFRPPSTPDTPYIKRIVAIGGDDVRFSGDQFFLNGVAQKESYLEVSDGVADAFESRVPMGFVFVAGDNRAHSVDSRHFGPVPVASIIGRVCATL